MVAISKVLTMTAAAALLVAGCGGGGGDTSSSPAAATTTPMPSMSETTHSAAAGEPALVAVPGYSYSSAPGSLEQQFGALKDGKILSSMSVHSVTKDGSDVGYLLLYGLSDSAAKKVSDNPAAAETIVNGMAGGMSGSGGNVHQETMSGQKVVVATVGSGDQSGSIYAWYGDAMISMFIGKDAATASSFVNAYLEAANA
ncbi:MAG: hypothetical protein WAN48_08745 [Actinomycetes bacterium]